MSSGSAILRTALTSSRPRNPAATKAAVIAPNDSPAAALNRQPRDSPARTAPAWANPPTPPPMNKPVTSLKWIDFVGIMGSKL